MTDELPPVPTIVVFTGDDVVALRSIFEQWTGEGFAYRAPVTEEVLDRFESKLGYVWPSPPTKVEQPPGPNDPVTWEVEVEWIEGFPTIAPFILFSTECLCGEKIVTTDETKLGGLLAEHHHCEGG